MGMVADQVYEREKSNNLMVYILSHIVEFRNGESGMHVLNVQAMTEMILTQLIDVYKRQRSGRVGLQFRALQD